MKSLKTLGIELVSMNFSIKEIFPKLKDVISYLTTMRLLSILFFTFSFVLVFGQKIDNTASYREIISEKYFRINYDNDYFAAQDQNYTQGYSFELVTPFLVKNPINKLFFHLKNDRRRAGIKFEHTGFTPDQYQKFEIQQNDRPFAAVALIKSFDISMSEESKQRVTSHFSFGILGPAAKGKEIQTYIHRLIGDKVPNGWRNQIKNHFVLNYGIEYEKAIVRVKDNFGLYTNVSAKIGNLYTNATAGFTSTFGLINDPYHISGSKKILLYGYIQPLVTIVGYDGTLQGGIVGDESVYTISSRDVNRVVGQINYGIVFQTKKIYLEYSRVNISKEIKTLSPAGWGGIKIGFKI